MSDNQRPGSEPEPPGENPPGGYRPGGDPYLTNGMHAEGAPGQPGPPPPPGGFATPPPPPYGPGAPPAGGPGLPPPQSGPPSYAGAPGPGLPPYGSDPPPGGSGMPPYGPDPGLPPYSPGMPEPGTFYEQPGGPASGVPYDQPGMPASGMPYGPGVPPPDSGSPYGPPTAPWGQPAPVPTTSGKLSGGAIAGIVAGGCALLLVVVLGLVFLVHAGNEANRKAAQARASASAAAEESESASDSPSPSDSVSPTDEYRDPTDLDDEDTDPVPFELDSIFPETAAGLTLDSEGFFSACSDAGDSNTGALLRKHDCGNMATADYPDPDKKLLASVMVIPLPTDDDADAVEKGLNGHGSAFNGLHYFCPKSGAASHLCDDGATPRWRAYYGAYHRYVIIVTVLRYDGALPSNKKADSTGNGVFHAIEDTLLGE